MLAKQQYVDQMALRRRAGAGVVAMVVGQAATEGNPSSAAAPAEPGLLAAPAAEAEAGGRNAGRADGSGSSSASSMVAAGVPAEKESVAVEAVEARRKRLGMGAAAASTEPQVLASGTAEHLPGAAAKPVLRCVRKELTLTDLSR
jgi:hypothetical protein